MEIWIVAAAWVQAIGSIAAIFGAAWAAGVPLRAQERERVRTRDERLSMIERASSDLIASRKPCALGLVERDHAAYEEGSKAMDTSQHIRARTMLDLPASDWPSVELRASMLSLHEAAEALDDAIARTGSYGVAMANSQITGRAARAFLAAERSYTEAWAHFRSSLK